MPIHDSMLLAYDAGEREVGLKKLARTKAGFPMTEISEILGKGKKKINFLEALQDEEKRDLAISYAGADPIGTYRIIDPLLDSMTPGMIRHYEEIELPLMPVLWQYEERGILMDRERLEGLTEEFDRELELRDRELLDLLQVESLDALSSPKKLGPLLVSRGIQLVDTTKTGQLSTDEKALLRAVGVVNENELDDSQYAQAVVKALLGRRGTTKLRTTYTVALANLLDPQGVVHTRFNQGGYEKDATSLDARTAPNTGRLSSSDPNLQNIPIRGAIGSAIRRCFVARPGYIWVCGDHSQLEFRIWASVTHSDVMIQAFKDGKDPHGEVALALHIPRGDAKNGVYAKMYGAATPKLIVTWKVPARDVPKVIHDLEQKMPALLTYDKDIEAKLAQFGYIETLYGFRIYFPDYHSPLRSDQASSVRQACNAYIQGTAADIVKREQIRMAEVCRELGAHGLLQVHDELNFEVPDDPGIVSEFCKEFEKEGLRAAEDTLCVPTPLDVHTGRSWGEAKGS